MPTLPTLTVSDVQANAMLQAWGTPEAYLDWLTRQIKGYVLANETRKIDAEVEAERQQRMAELIARLGI